MKKTKIVATIGPATSDPAIIRRLIEEGVDVARLNFSHGDHPLHRQSFEAIREQSGKTGIPVAILADLGGPKIRVGTMSGGAVTLEEGGRVTLTAEEVVGTPRRITTGYAALARDVRKGDPILLDDGLIRLEVESIRDGEVTCRVIVGGVLRDRKGMNDVA